MLKDNSACATDILNNYFPTVFKGWIDGAEIVEKFKVLW